MPWRPPRARKPERRRYPLRQRPLGSYTSSEWRRTRKAVLERDPICVSCGRRPSVICDHIVTRRAGGSDDMSNLRGVCVTCDRRDSLRFDGGFGMPTRAGKPGA
jgi:5-methylcytosine-specific restriction endonuclease McrA